MVVTKTLHREEWTRKESIPCLFQWTFPLRKVCGKSCAKNWTKIRTKLFFELFSEEQFLEDDDDHDDNVEDQDDDHDEDYDDHHHIGPISDSISGLSLVFFRI